MAKFPCPVCARPQEVRQTKKNKPYIVCDPCSVQLFVRGPAGVAAFNRLVESAERDDVWTRLADLEPRYQLECPECGCQFWVELELAKTNWVDGSFLGFRCPAEDCGTIVKWEKKG